ncbi:MAG: hypothetical protein WCV79_00955 [Candidatus Paceibacterota bacterium]
MSKIIRHHKRWKYKNTLILLTSLLALFFISDSIYVSQIMNAISGLGYVGAFFAGFFFVSTFTIAPAGLVLYHLSFVLDPILMSLIGGLGGVIGDFIIFSFFKDKVLEEITPIYNALGGSHLTRLVGTPYFAWFAPVLGALIIASPFPDELGIGLMGIAKLKKWQFITISFVMNTLGILAVAELHRLL